MRTPARARQRERVGRRLAAGHEQIHAGELRDAAVHRIGRDRRRAQMKALAKTRQVRTRRKPARECRVGRMLVSQLLAHALDERVGDASGLLVGRIGRQRVHRWDRLAFLVRVGVAHLTAEPGPTQHDDEAMPHARLHQHFDIVDASDLALKSGHQSRTALARDAAGPPVGHHSTGVDGAEVGARRHVAGL